MDRREWVAYLSVAFKQRVHSSFSIIKTPPATEVADGVFEPIFPVDFSTFSTCSAKQPTVWRDVPQNQFLF
jgi:hypothetical protein